ncbi:MAG: ring-cleaving dioxygenase [Bacteroidota bacterium]
MDPRTFLQGLHHVTATVSDAQEDLDFYTRLLGLRLVKQTVNFDNNQVYHFYYGTETGTPGTIMTTFPYKGQGVRQGVNGTGQVSVTAFSVPEDALDYWEDRLTDAGVSVSHLTRFGAAVLRFRDPSGLFLDLVAQVQDPRAAWIGGEIDPVYAIRGFHSVILRMADVKETLSFLTEGLGFLKQQSEGRYTRLSLQSSLPGQLVDIEAAPEAERGLNGMGTVHHVAWRIPNDDMLAQMREHLVNTYGLRVTDIKDRKYFHSIYFRIPGGVLFEIATIPPGFDVDETPEGLGRALKLPEWEEPNRHEIESNLPQIRF